jgi:putative transposase
MGSGKIRAALKREGIHVAKNRAARLMRELGIRGAARGRRYRTTVPDSSHARAEDLVARDFSAPAPNRLWVMDFTYVPTWAGMTYVAS